MMLYQTWLVVTTVSCLMTTVGCQTTQYHPQECKLTKPGVEYAGTITVTVSGYTCQAWTVDSPHDNYFKSSTRFPEGSAAHARNYCRNPDTTYGGGVWCYTTDTSMRWEVCNVSFCECKVDEAGEQYQGQETRTVNGRTCQAWNTQSPHPHPFTAANMFPDASMTDVGNACRNPFAAYRPGGPWCYTTDAAVKWEYCDVDYCNFPNTSVSTLIAIVKNESLEMTTDAMAMATSNATTVDTKTPVSVATVDTNTTDTITTASLDTVTTSVASLNVTFQQGTAEISDVRTSPFLIGSTQVAWQDAAISTDLLASASHEFEDELVDEMSAASLIIIIVAVVVVVIVVTVMTVMVWRKTRPDPKKEERDSFDNPSYGGSKDQLQPDQGAAVTLTNLSPNPAV